MADEICKEYESSLKDLTFNSKPHISMMTMLAEENVHYAPQIVKVIEAHLQKPTSSARVTAIPLHKAPNDGIKAVHSLNVKAECKLPTMYLIDSIVKNVGSAYSSLFVQNVVSNFCAVFEKVDEKVRMQLYKLRQTWADIFPNKKLYAIDVRVKQLDPAWPITAQPPQQSSIHFNPKFLKPTPEETDKSKKVQDMQEEEMRKQLLSKQQELLKLQRQKLELELLQTQVMVEEQKRQLILKEQQVLRVQQNAQVDVQTVFQQQEVALAASAGAHDGLCANVLDHSKADQNKVASGSYFGANVMEQLPESNVHGSNHKELASSTTAAAKNSQTVISSHVLNNKTTIDTNSVAKRGPFGFNKNNNSNDVDPLVSAAEIVFGHSGICQAKFPAKSDCIASDCSKQLSSAVPPVSLAKQGSGTVGGIKGSKSKTSPGKMPTKATSKEGSPKKSKESRKKSQTPSPTKKKESSNDGKSVNSKSESSRNSSRKPDSKEGTSSSRTSSKSVSKGKSKSGGKGKADQSSRSSSRGHSRSPGRSGEKEERPSKRSRRSPRKEKENDGKISGGDTAKSKTLSFSSHKLDVDLRTPLEAVTMKRDGRSASLEKCTEGEPPLKKSRADDPDLDDIFGGKDQDYRQLGHPVPRLSPIGEKSWAQYKASRPEEFKNPARSRDNIDPFGFGNQDLDLRQSSMGHGVRQEQQQWAGEDPRMSGHRDPRMRRSDFRSSRSRFSPRLPPHQQIYQATQESDPNIPRALMFDRGADIMRQADQQLRSGHLTLEQHAELMEQLAKLYELQRMRHMQREQHVRETVILNRKLSRDDPVLSEGPLSIDNTEKSKSKSAKAFETNAKVPALVEKSEDPRENLPSSVDAKVESDANDDDKDIEVIVIDDAPIPPTKPEGKRRESRWSSPVTGPPANSKQQPAAIHTVMIDDKPREVRFVDGKAIVLLDNDDVREIGFRGPPQEVIFGKVFVRLGFGNVPKEFELDGHKHTVRFGAPTREIIIDGVPFAAVFGGPSIVVALDGKPCEVRLSGPTPEVFFGDKPRSDLLSLLGHVKQPIIEPRKDTPNKRGMQQRSGSPMRWVTSTIGRDYEGRDFKSGRDTWQGSSNAHDSYRRGQYHRVDCRSRDDYEQWGRENDFRGMSRGAVMGRGDRLRAVRHGSPQVEDVYDRQSRDSPYRDSMDQRPGGGYYQQRDVRFHGSYHGGPPRMVTPMGISQHRYDGPTSGNHLHRPPVRSPAMVQYPIPFGYRNVQQPSRSNFGPSASNDFNFNPNVLRPGVPTMVPPPLPVPPPAQPQIDVGELFSKLVATGIIQQVAVGAVDKKMDGSEEEASRQLQQQDKAGDADQSAEKIPPIELASECLKVRQPLVISQLYCGIQCSSCGVRFTSEQTDKYAQHLDWHFRQNRREKSSARKALSRKWYYDIQDWVQFEEIEDLEERARSFFELQVNEDQGENVEESAPSVPAGEDESDKKCCVCQEPFELYWDEEHEEWHFRDAIRKDEKNYHPLCFEDMEDVESGSVSQEIGSHPDVVDTELQKSDVDGDSGQVGVIAESSDVDAKDEIKKEKEEVEEEEEESDGIKKEIDVKVEPMTEEEATKSTDDASRETEEVAPRTTEVESAEAVSAEEKTEEEMSTEVSDGMEVVTDERRDEEGAEKDAKEDEPTKDGEEEPAAADGGDLFSIFNVMSSNYSIPPLIGFETVEDKVESYEESKEEMDEATEPMPVSEGEAGAPAEPEQVEEREKESVIDQPKAETREEMTPSPELTAQLAENDEIEHSNEVNDVGGDEMEVEAGASGESLPEEMETSPPLEEQADQADAEDDDGGPSFTFASKDEEDISLKESSDVIVDFAFDQPDKPNVEGDEDRSNDGSEDDDLTRFQVLPPVERGTELSGLCSIM